MSANFELNKEPLWAIPQPVQERLRLDHAPNEYDNFLLSVFYSAVAVFFLVLFSASSFIEGNRPHGVVLSLFAAVTILGQLALWLGQWYAMGKHLTTMMMVLLCLYLFYSGGVQNTGPLYYGVFPSVALFLQGRFNGFIWVVCLLVVTVVISQGVFGFDVTRYSNIFVARMLAITLIIAMLTCIPEYFRIKAERNLLLSQNDIESLTYGDLTTQLANRALLEKMLMLEHNRHDRYGSDCCVMMIEADAPVPAMAALEAANDAYAPFSLVAGILRRNLRVQDVAGRWDNNSFFLILPECTLEGTRVLAERLLAEVRAEAGTYGSNLPLRLTASIGIAALEKGSPQDLLQRVSSRLSLARSRGGNCYVAAA